ncbi:MAG TPA: gfo/Idh/MocA family oxidoreductase [Cyanobacteria bacterium UBA8803]|nr:gfo/Idh/MocA family oxidoreductase [Cyanobacteria bacterium UBA9273]HBL57848.1 gfo/Idh/MocA family oxidoreductase [Cyanobacteria bacterium UBA8803]
MTKMLKAAVIGTGVISKEHLSFLDQSDRAHLVSVCDLSPAAARYAAQRYHADSTYTDYHQMLDEVTPDVVHILTPPQTHLQIAKDCLAAGTHVICEKPITPTYDEFKELWAIAQSHNRCLIENHNYRFNESILAIEKLVKDGLLGEVQEVEVRIALAVRSGGAFADENLPHPIHKLPAGVVHDVITHLCYLVLRFLPDFDRISAAWSNHGGGDLFKYDDLDAILIAGSQHARLRFSCHTLPECFAVTVRGSRGYAETDLFQPYLRCVIPRKAGKLLSPLINHFVNGYELMGASLTNFRRKIMQQTPYEGLHRLLDKTYEALSEGNPPPISFEDMERTSRLIAALLAEGNRV